MIDRAHNKGCIIYDEMDDESLRDWFDYKQKKFLHNIDTFYYTVKLREDFTSTSEDTRVFQFKYELSKKKKLVTDGFGRSVQFFVKGMGNLNVLAGSFDMFYKFQLSLPDSFDIFIAPVVPKSGDCEGFSVTPEILVQIRSRYLWNYGVVGAFEKSLEWVRKLLRPYNLHILEINENRCDFCFHTNYFLSPEKFFTNENIYKLKVSRFRDSSSHSVNKGSEGFDMDFMSFGRRGGNCYLRIYNKTKEVIEMNYKPFFFDVWYLERVINKYDLFCYQESYKQRSWAYMDVARLRWYLDNGSNEEYLRIAKGFVDNYELHGVVSDDLMAFADLITPKVNLIVNIEFQVNRRATKSYKFIDFYDRSDKAESERVYRFFDNHVLITEYLTRETFRLVEGDDKNKSRRDYHPFWERLRSSIHAFVNLRLKRDNEHKLNLEVMKRKFANSAVSLSFYNKGENHDKFGSDVLDALSMLNDNDIMRANRYKNKRLNFLIPSLRDRPDDPVLSDLSIVASDGIVYDRGDFEWFYLVGRSA